MSEKSETINGIKKTKTWQERLAEIKSSQPAEGSAEQLEAVQIIAPSDNGSLTPVEQVIEADRKFGLTVEQKHVDDSITRATEAVLADQLYTEVVERQSALYDKEKAKACFISAVQSCLGKTRDEVEQMIVDRNQMLYDDRSTLQGLLAYRSEMLKDATAEERAKALREDWLFQPKTKEGKKEKPTAPKKEKKSMFETMRDAMIAFKGISLEEAERKLIAKGYKP